MSTSIDHRKKFRKGRRSPIATPKLGQSKGPFPRGPLRPLLFFDGISRSGQGGARRKGHWVESASRPTVQAIKMQQCGRYQVLHKLGQGAMSAVYLARDPMLSRLTAIKVLHPDLLYQPATLNRFFKEAKAVSRVNSPNVVQVFDFGMQGKLPYLVMEFIDGQTLQRILNSLDGEPMEPIVAACLLLQIAEGLQATSELGIVHRDLKPDNLLLSRKGHIKISDFGICHLKDHTLTATGQVLGSPRFMSPEQVRGSKPITAQSDLFSLGAVAYTLLSGFPPFQAETVPDLYRQIVQEPHRPLSEARPGLDRSLARWVDGLLSKEPGKRGSGPKETIQVLRSYVLRKKVAAPVERIAAYVHHLSEIGIQTTCDLQPDQIRQYLGTLDLGKTPQRRVRIRAAFALTTMGIILTLAGMAWKHLETTRAFKGQAPQQQAIPVGVLNEATPPQPIALGSSPQSTSHRIVPEKIEAPQPQVQAALPDTSQAVLSVQTIPPFAEVLVDGLPFGRTPLEGALLSQGLHHISIRSRFAPVKDTAVHLLAGPQTVRIVLAGDLSDEGAN
jgi:eukaryotic-like serine/threonine-protein kinase